MVRFGVGCTALLAFAGMVSGCATPGGWKGVAGEKQYEAAQAAKAPAPAKSTEVADNNDDYYEVHKDGRIYVFSDAEPLAIWRQTGEVPLVVTQIGAGPAGETVKLQLNKTEADAMVKTVGYKGAAQRMYEGSLEPAAAFYAEVFSPSRVYVFDSGATLAAYRNSGHVACGVTQIGVGPASETVVFAQDCESAAKGHPKAAMSRFAGRYRRG